MTEWIEPVFDRTQADVDFAILKLQEWKENNLLDTYDLKGCFNVSDINRIEQDIEYLSDNLTDLYYFTYTVSKKWDRQGLPSVTEVSRIINNVRLIINSYYQQNNAPALPESLLSIEQVNSLEENLYLIKQILDDMILSFKECDTFECGEE